MNKTFLLILAGLTLSACGKSLHMAQKADNKSTSANGETQQRNGGAQGGSGSTTGGQGSDGSSSGATSGAGAGTGTIEPVIANPAIPEEPTGQKLGNLSKRDYDELGLGKMLLPFGAEGLQFRALHYLPDAGDVETVSSIRLVLKDLKLNGSSVIEGQTDISKLTLCVIEESVPVCVGGDVPTGFNSINAGFVTSGLTKALPLEAVKDAEGVWQVDLMEAFDLKNKYAIEIMRFLEKISVQYDVSGYRKFRLSLGRNAEFSEGSFEIQMVLKGDAVQKPVEIPGKPISPSDDESVSGAAATPQKGSVQLTLDQSKMEFKRIRRGVHEIQGSGKDKLDRTANAIATYQSSIENIVIENESKSNSLDNSLKVSAIRLKKVEKPIVEKAPGLSSKLEMKAVGNNTQEVTRIKIEMKDGSKTSKLQQELDKIWN